MDINEFAKFPDPDSEAKIVRVDKHLRKAIDVSIEEGLPVLVIYTMLMYYATDLMEQLREQRKAEVAASKKREE